MPRLAKDERTKAFSIRLTEDEFNAIAVLAAETGVPTSNYIRMALKQHIKQTLDDRS